MQTNNYSVLSSSRTSTQSSYRQPPGTLNTSEQNTTIDSDIDDTIHYISPATSSARTEHEGDVCYRFYPMYPKPFGPLYSYASSSTISCVEPKIQRTLAIVKPEGMAYKDVVLRAVNQAGFTTVNARTIQATPEQISELYAQHYGSPSFPHLVITMSAAPILVLSLAGLNAVEKWKNMVGPYKALKEQWFFPTSIRRKFGLREEIPNALHASETVQKAHKENRYFFPKSILEPLMSDEEQITDYCNLYIKPTLLKGVTLLAKVKPQDPICYLAEWLLLNNPNQPKFPQEIALTPT